MAIFITPLLGLLYMIFTLRAAVAPVPTAPPPAPSKPPSIGDHAPEFKLPSVGGSQVTLAQYADRNAICVMFIATQCPVSNAYNERMAAMADEYAAKGVQFVGVNSNKQEPFAEVVSHAKEHNFHFPVLKDTLNLVADRYGAGVTPECFLLKPDLTLAYHGRIDDNMKIAKVTTHDLHDALEDVLAGRAVAHTEMKAIGCTIKRVQAN
jgi:peroxiredoxin